MKKKLKHKSLEWNQVEKLVQDEMVWLKKNVQTYFKDRDTAGHYSCTNCALRIIALLMVYGDVEAKEIRKDGNLKDFWLNNSHTLKNNIYHGKDWHRETMS